MACNLVVYVDAQLTYDVIYFVQLLVESDIIVFISR